MLGALSGVMLGWGLFIVGYWALATIGEKKGWKWKKNRNP